MSNPMRTTWLSVRRRATAYLALAALLALIGVAVGPYRHYNNWVNEGQLLGQEAVELGRQAAERGDYSQTWWHFERALDYYSRPLIFDHPQSLELKFHLAQIYHYNFRDSALAKAYYASLMDSEAYSFDSLAGLWLLREKLPPDDELQAVIAHKVARYSNEALATAPPDPQLSEEAARYYYALGNAFTFQKDFAQAKTAFARAWELSPGTMAYQQAAESTLSSAVAFYLGHDYSPILGRAILRRICWSVLNMKVSDFEHTLCRAAHNQALGQYGEASDFYERALELKAEDDTLRLVTAANYYSWAQQLAYRDQLDKALLAYQRAYALAPQDSGYAQAAQATPVTLTVELVAKEARAEAVAGARVQIQGLNVGLTDATGHLQVARSFLSTDTLSIDVHAPGAGFFATELNLDPQQTNYSLVATLKSTSAPIYVLFDRARAQALAGQRVHAEVTFKQAVQWASQTADAGLNYSLCWQGSLDGFAEVSLPACEHAVTLASAEGEYSDSRGLARALTGDYSGARADFKRYLAWAEQSGRTVSRTTERARWIAELEAGRNPFDAATLALLRYELEHSGSLRGSVGR